MKEFQSTQGGRHVYNSDFKYLQELSLAMQEIFRDCGGNFVISGCEVTSSDSSVSVSAGYVYIDGRVRSVAAASGLSLTNLYIVGSQQNGDSIPYADNTNHPQCINYYAEAKNSDSVNSGHIAYDSTYKAFPNLATAFFNYYAVCKKAGAQSVNTLTVQQKLTAAKEFMASQGIIIASTNTKITSDGQYMTFAVGDYSFKFGYDGTISILSGTETLLSFSNASGSGTVTYANVTVTENLKTNKLYLGGVDIENKLVPLGMVQMWCGSVNNLPDNYKLCDGQALSTTDYADLYSVLGTTFNTAINQNGNKWSAPGSGMFRLPDLRGRFIVGYDSSTTDYSNIANYGGEKVHALKSGEMPSHSHQIDDYYYIESASGANKGTKWGNTLALDNKYTGSGASDTDNNTILYKTHDSSETGHGDAHENRPPYYVLAYVMRVK